MSTVTTSTSNIERSPHFLSKQALGKAQTANPLANAFAALLQSAEESDAPPTADPTDPLADDTQPSARRTKNETPPSAADAGQAALAGLLNWQALSATGGGTPAAASTPPGLPNSPLNSLPGSLSALANTPQADGTMLGTTTSTTATAEATLATASAPLQQTTASPFSLGTPVAAPSLAPGDAPQPVSGGALPAPDINQASTSAKVDPFTQPVAKALADTSVGGAAQASEVAKSASPAGAAQWAADALAAGAEKPHTTKSRVGMARNALPTATSSATSFSQSGNVAGSPHASASAAMPETGVLPRATVDLIARNASTQSPDDAETETNATDALALKPEVAPTAVQTTAPGQESAYATEQAPASLAAPDTVATNTPPTDQMLNIMDELSGQIAYWAAQGNQRASLTVGEDTDNPLEVSIAMRDGEVHVAFEAAQGDIRDALTASAEALLRDMLESKGMTLGDITVSHRQPAAQHDAPTPDRRNPGDTAATRGVSGSHARPQAAGSADSAALAPRRPHIATAQKVDLYA